MFGRRGPPKTTPSSVLCQKCLKRGHYSYECKVAPQDRPYKGRPSRSQQLRNPKLAPKLHEETFDDAQLKQGVADGELAKREAERAKKHKRRHSDSGTGSDSETHSHHRDAARGAKQSKSRGRRSPSDSDSDSDSGSASSSRSASPASPRRGATLAIEAGPAAPASGGRRRSVSSASRSASASSYSSDGDRPPRRRRSLSVRSGAGSERAATPQRRGPSPPPVRRDVSHERSVRPRDDRMKSSDFFGGTRAAGPADGSRSPSRDSGPHRPYRQRDDDGRDSRRGGERTGGERQPPAERRADEGGGRERSLSPFSRRLALTKQMKQGR